MSDRAAEARKAFGVRLKDLRLDARLNGRQLAEETGLHFTKVSRVENGRQSPSEDDIRAWATACGVAREIPELIAAHREIDQMWKEWRRELRAGQKHVQSSGLALYEQTELLCVYESRCVPGILQTHRYVLKLFKAAEELYDLPEGEAEAAAEGRLPRQRLITSGTGANRYSFLIEPAVLELLIGSTDVMLEQLDFLTQVSRLPHVALGIISPTRPRALWSGESFYMFDGKLVRAELWTGSYQTRRADEIATFAKAFGMLRELAVYGDEARALIDAAKVRLQHLETT